MSSKNIVYVTQPILPDLEKLMPYLQKIWDNKILTNGGPFHQILESALCDYLGVKYISLFSNGMQALITTIQFLGLHGEVITTPYSFVATAHSLLWSHVKPVFVDIDSNTLNIDPVKIEAAITPETSAIMPVHCYGHPCDSIAIQKIADKYKLKVIYDAAHAFGVCDQYGSILNHGTLSVLSFHATKVFNTFEGGAIVSHDDETKHRIDQLKSFGFVNETSVEYIGTNGKMSEIHAAIGLLQLEGMPTALAERCKIDHQYRSGLKNIPGISCVNLTNETIANYAYFPILVSYPYPLSRDALFETFKKNNIYPRRYFYPLITEFPMYKNLDSAAAIKLPIAHKVASEVICLPIYPGLSEAQVDFINS